MPSPLPYFEISKVFWKRPGNQREIVDAVRWAAQNQTFFTLNGPDYLVANCTSQPKNRLFLVHLVNYNAAQIPEVPALQGRVALPDQKPALKITLYTPEGSARPLDFENGSSGATFSIPGMRVYGLVAIQW